MAFISQKNAYIKNSQANSTYTITTPHKIPLARHIHLSEDNILDQSRHQRRLTLNERT